MDELKDFFGASKTPQRVILKGSQTGGAMKFEKQEEEYLPTPVSPLGVDYVEKFKLLEMKAALELSQQPKPWASDEVRRVQEDSMANVFNKYCLKMNNSQEYVIDKFKANIMANIKSVPVTIVEGPTGCGKTTQVPQWILEDHFRRKKFCNIIVTQPRRIATVSIAKRVCEVNDLELGGLVGYQIGLNKKTSVDTILQYVTTGVLLQMLVSNQNLNSFTHIILDEVHERDQEMDFLLIVVRKLLYTTHCRDIKIILMSATFEAERFSEYFAAPGVEKIDMFPVISVDNAKSHEVKMFYLDDLFRLPLKPVIKPDILRIPLETFHFIIHLLNAFEFMDTQEEKNAANSRPSVLIFLPGIREIETAYNVFSCQETRKDIHEDRASLKWWVIPLHSSITSEEQAKVFQKPPPHHRKIILATNIAESSITVPDIKYVIDFCLTKILVSDMASNFSSLQLSWASKANCNQRAGRAGRVRPGRVYRIVPKQFYEDLDQYSLPEMMRCPLERLVLLTKLLNMGSPCSILALAMDPPDLSNINRTILNLKEIGAMVKTVDGKISTEDGDITHLGRVMAKLPVDVRISKLIMLGYIFGCLNECIIMGAAMCTKNVFANPFMDKLSAYNSKLTYADGCSSDSIAFLNVYTVYQTLKQQRYFTSFEGGEKWWVKTSHLQLNALHDMENLVTELRCRLEREGIEEKKIGKPLWNKVELPLILKIVIAGAFYPYYFSLGQSGDEMEREATKTIGGRDPCNTVYLTGMDPNQPAPIYSKFFKDAFRCCTDEDVIVNFDSISSKVYITFPKKEASSIANFKPEVTMPGSISFPVYKAIKMRQLRLPITVNVMPHAAAVKYAAEMGLFHDSSVRNFGHALQPEERPVHRIMQSRLPEVDESHLNLRISNMTECGQFWCHLAEKRSVQELQWISAFLNDDKTKLIKELNPKVGEFCAAPFQSRNSSPTMNYRAKILKLLPNDMVKVLFIDYGNEATVPSVSLRAFGIHTMNMMAKRPLAFQCTLSEVKPSLLKDQRAIWTDEANAWFFNKTRQQNLLGKVYSVTHSIVHLELFIGNESINQMLIKEGYAEPKEESYASKMNREMRITADTMHPLERNALNKTQEKENMSICEEPCDPPSRVMCTRILTLSGPHSPLETKVYGLMNISRNKNTLIDPSSINSVLLNTDPQQRNERLLVTADIDQSSEGSKLNLRQTTLMPNIPGFPALLAMLFCPTAELRRNATGKRYSSVLCGLGHSDGKPLFREHDLLINIDVDFTENDINNINHLRFNMDCMMSDNSPPNMTLEVFQSNAQCKIQSLILGMISTPRKHVEVCAVPNEWQWNSTVGTDLLFAPSYADLAVFPLHNGLTLNKMTSHDLYLKYVENKRIHNLCQGYLSKGDQEIFCKLCDLGPFNVTSLRLHLHSLNHKMWEAELPGDEEVQQ